MKTGLDQYTDIIIYAVKNSAAKLKVWYNPNLTLISKIFKELSCLQRKTA